MTSTTQPLWMTGTTDYNGHGASVGSTFGALKYNFNEMIGWRLGDPTSDEICLYSDIAYAGNFYYFNQSPSTQVLFKQYGTYTKDQKLADLISVLYTTTFEVQSGTWTADDYNKKFGKLDGIFGIPWLPWNVWGLKDANGDYQVKYYPKPTNADFIQPNPLGRGVLYIKMFTILKMLGISMGIGGIIYGIYKYEKNQH